jgi:hypothetical protein
LNTEEASLQTLVDRDINRKENGFVIYKYFQPLHKILLISKLSSLYLEITMQFQVLIVLKLTLLPNSNSIYSKKRKEKKNTMDFDPS